MKKNRENWNVNNCLNCLTCRFAEENFNFSSVIFYKIVKLTCKQISKFYDILISRTNSQTEFYNFEPFQFHRKNCQKSTAKLKSYCTWNANWAKNECYPTETGYSRNHCHGHDGRQSTHSAAKWKLNGTSLKMKMLNAIKRYALRQNLWKLLQWLTFKLSVKLFLGRKITSNSENFRNFKILSRFVNLFYLCLHSQWSWDSQQS